MASSNATVVALLNSNKPIRVRSTVGGQLRINMGKGKFRDLTPGQTTDLTKHREELKANPQDFVKLCNKGFIEVV